jgi:arylsulfatase A-like enzyme
MNAIALILRGCPVGWLGAYGNEWVGTPHLDALAAESAVFDRHVSDCPDPAAANRAWLTGRYQFPPMESEPPSPPPENLLMKLKAAGVRTVLVRANRTENDSPAPFYDGWAELFDARPDTDDASPLDALLRSLPAVLDRLAGVPRWFLAIDIDRLLPPWDVPQDVFEAYVEDPDEEEREDEEEDEPKEDAEPVTPYADPPTGPFDRADFAAWEWLHRTFAALVTTLDAELGDLFKQFRTRGLHDSAMWLLTSDFGYPLGEHGQVGRYRPWLHEELVHLPLLLRLPGAAEAGRRVPALTQPPDLYATVLEAFGFPNAAGHGRSLLGIARSGEEETRAQVCTGLELNGVREWAIRTPEWALLLPGPQPEGEPARPPMLFGKPDDRWEVNDLYTHQTEKAEGLEAELRRIVASADS